MGQLFTTDKASVQNKMLNLAFDSCRPITTTQTFDVENLKHQPVVGSRCENPKFEPKSNSVVDGQCLVNSLQTVAANSAAKLGPNFRSGLGFDIGTDTIQTKISIQNAINKSCGSIPNTSNPSLESTVSNECDFRLIHAQNDRQACEINAGQKILGDVAQNASLNTNQTNIFNKIFGNIPLVVSIVLILLIVGILLVWLLRTKTNVSDLDGINMFGGNTGDCPNQTILTIVVIGLAILVLFSVYQYTMYQSRLRLLNNMQYYEQ